MGSKLLSLFVFFYSLLCICYCDNGTGERVSILKDLLTRQTRQIDELKNHVATQSETISKLQGDIEKINRRTTANERDTSILKSLLKRTSMKPSFTEDIDSHIMHNNFEDTQAGKDEIVIDTSGKTGKQVKRILDQSPVAFYAYLTTSETSLGRHHTIIFDHVVTNVGNGYNKHAGDFIVPVSGVYAMSVTITSAYRSCILTELVVNGNPVIPSNACSRSIDLDLSSTNTVVLSLSQGDTCFVRTHKDYDSSGTLLSDNYDRSSFSGWKISE